MSQASPAVSPMRWSKPWWDGARALAAREAPVTAAAANDHATAFRVVAVGTRLRSASPPSSGVAVSAT